MRKVIILMACLFLIAGCASVDKRSISKAYYSVNRSDGINKEEATAIAQHCVLEHKAENYWFVNSPKVKNYGDFWCVVFTPKYFFAIDADKSKPLEILVLKQDGTIPHEDDLKFK